jgi:calmodulin
MVEQLTEEQIEEFKGTFSLFDSHGNGTINMEELECVMRSLNQKPTAGDLQVAVDRDGTIDISEFLALMVNRLKNTDTEERLIKACKVFDSDDNGTISASQLHQVVTNIRGLSNEQLGRVRVARQLVDSMIREGELEKDGPIHYEDFVKTIMGVTERKSSRSRKAGHVLSAFKGA